MFEQQKPFCFRAILQQIFSQFRHVKFFSVCSVHQGQLEIILFSQAFRHQLFDEMLRSFGNNPFFGFSLFSSLKYCNINIRPDNAPLNLQFSIPFNQFACICSDDFVNDDKKEILLNVSFWVQLRMFRSDFFQVYL